MPLESKKELLKELPEPTQRERESFQMVLNKQSMLVNSSERDHYVMLMEETLIRIAKKQTKTSRRIQDIRLSYVFVETDVVCTCTPILILFILTLFQAMSVPNHTFHCIPFTTAHTQSW